MLSGRPSISKVGKAALCSGAVLMGAGGVGCGDTADPGQQNETAQQEEQQSEGPDDPEIVTLEYETSHLETMDGRLRGTVAEGARVDIEVVNVDAVDEVKVESESVFEVTSLEYHELTLEAVGEGRSEIEVVPATPPEELGGEPAGGYSNTTFELRVEPVESMGLELDCGVRSLLDSLAAFPEMGVTPVVADTPNVLDVELNWITEYDEARGMTGYGLRPLTVEPQEALEWTNEHVEFNDGPERTFDFVVESPVESVTLESDVDDETVVMDVVDTPESSDIGLFRVEGEPGDWGEWIDDEDVELTTHFRDDSQALSLEEHAVYQFLPVAYFGDEPVCDPIEDGGWFPSIGGSEFRLQTHTPDTCKVSGLVLDGEDIPEGDNEYTTGFVSSLLPVGEGECTFSVEYLEGALEGHNEKWSWTIED